MADQVLVTFDFTNLESADNGAFTTYGGSYLVDGNEKRGYGDDRDTSNPFWDTVQDVIDVCRAKWPGADNDAFLSDQVTDAVQEAFDNVGHITVTWHHETSNFTVETTIL